MSFILGIAGCTASGKTFLSDRICRALGERNVSIVRADDYYISRPFLSLEERAEMNYDVPQAIDFQALAHHLRLLKSGNSIYSPKYDFSVHLSTKDLIQVLPTPLVVLEGIFLLCDDSVRGLLDASVFVDTSLDVCLARRLARDVRERGRTEESVRAQWRKDVEPGYFKYCRPSLVNANLVVSEEDVNCEKIISAFNLNTIVGLTPSSPVCASQVTV